MMNKKYTSVEMMAVAAARVLEDNSSVYVGTGLPLVACILAKKTHAPNLLLIFEGGAIGGDVKTLPLSVGDSRASFRALKCGSILDAGSIAQLGYADYGFVGGAQIDMYGNINSTCLGPHEKPKINFPGSGGGNDIASLCWKIVIVTRHDKRRFVKKLDFMTSPGYLDGPGARERAGLPAGSGPYRVITDLAVLGFDEKTKRMKLISTHPGVSVEQVMENTGFELLIPEKVATTEEPTEKELKLLREEIDPNGIYIR